MSRLRKDPIVGRWIIISTSRPRTPQDYPSQEPRNGVTPADCPFCRGNEAKTPQEIAVYRPENAARGDGDWWVRVIPSKFPVLQVEGGLDREGSGIYDWMNGVGAHEIIIETPEHGLRLEELPEGRVERVLAVYRDRMLDLERDERLRYVLIVKNEGYTAGAALDHGHSQLIATPIIPKLVKEKLDGAKSYFDYKERCIFCDMVRQELAESVRVVEETRHFAVFTPFAPRFPFEVWIYPKRHACAYPDITVEELADLGRVLRSTLRRIGTVLDQPPYNFMVYTAPNRIPRHGHWHTLQADFHWHVEVQPRLMQSAGFERGSGFYINPTPPEMAAQYLRDARP